MMSTKFVLEYILSKLLIKMMISNHISRLKNLSSKKRGYYHRFLSFVVDAKKIQVFSIKKKDVLMVSYHTS